MHQIRPGEEEFETSSAKPVTLYAHASLAHRQWLARHLNSGETHYYSWESPRFLSSAVQVAYDAIATDRHRLQFRHHVGSSSDSGSEEIVPVVQVIALAPGKMYQ